jgi:hypothetical protein
MPASKHLNAVVIAPRLSDVHPIAPGASSEYRPQQRHPGLKRLALWRSYVNHRPGCPDLLKKTPTSMGVQMGQG